MIKNFEESPAMMVGHFLKNELKRRKISQESFSETLGVDPRTVRRWISGGVNSVNTVCEIMQFFGLKNIGDIFSSEDDAPYVLKKIKKSANGQFSSSKRIFFCGIMLLN